MIIIWSGKGILSALVLVAVLFAGLFWLPDSLAENAPVIAFFIAGLFSWFFGNQWNKEVSLVDEKNKKRTYVKPNHTLFWIKMQYWGIIFAFITAFLLKEFSWVVSIVTAIVLAGYFTFYYTANWMSLRKAKTERENFKNRHFDKISSKEKTLEPLALKVEISDEEKLQRRLEKEDPSRFMPK